MLHVKTIDKMESAFFSLIGGVTSWTFFAIHYGIDSFRFDRLYYVRFGAIFTTDTWERIIVSAIVGAVGAGSAFLITTLLRHVKFQFKKARDRKNERKSWKQRHGIGFKK